MKNKGLPDKYNYLKSIKEKEQKILAYYKKVSNSNNEKLKPLPKPKKITKKNTQIYTEKKEDTINEEDKDDVKRKQKEHEQLKKTKKQIVIMDD
jgi:hypothetical protein